MCLSIIALLCRFCLVTFRQLHGFFPSFLVQLKRFKTYIYLLQAKIMAPPELEPSLVETAIGEDEEISLHGSPVASAPRPYYGPMSSMAMGTSASIGKGAFSKPVQRSLSDRYSYRAAIYNTERVEYDMI